MRQPPSNSAVGKHTDVSRDPGTVDTTTNLERAGRLPFPQVVSVI